MIPPAQRSRMDTLCQNRPQPRASLDQLPPTVPHHQHRRFGWPAAVRMPLATTSFQAEEPKLRRSTTKQRVRPTRCRSVAGEVRCPALGGGPQCSAKSLVARRRTCSASSCSVIRRTSSARLAVRGLSSCESGRHRSFLASSACADGATPSSLNQAEDKTPRASSSAKERWHCIGAAWRPFAA